MAAGWKKIILSGSEAELNEVTASQGIQISPGGVSVGGVNASSPLDVLVVSSSDFGSVYRLSGNLVGNQGSSLVSFVTMSVNGTATVSSSATTQNDTLNLTSSLGNPLTVTGTEGTDTVTITVATASREIVEDTADALLTGPHEGLTINYTDNSTSAGTFSLIGESSTSFANTTGQKGVSFASALDASIATTVGVNPASNVKFVNITASAYDYSIDNPGLPPGLITTIDNANNHYGDGNISQTTNLQYSAPGGLTYDTTVASGQPGEYISASALHITENASINNDLTMSGNFIFQGFVFDDAQVLVHSGSNIFGSGSMPTAVTNNAHQFTGSLFITGSGITLQQSNSFNGDGSGLTNLSLSSIEGLGLLSGSAQIASEISGAFQFISPTLRTASITDGTVSAITASGTTVTTGFLGLASGDQIFNFLSASDADFLNVIAAEYIVSASADDTSGLDIVTTGAIGSGPISQTIALNISKSVEESLAGADSIMFSDTNNSGVVRKGTINSLAFITGSSEGTVTSISAGNGIQVINPTGYSSGTVVDTTVHVVLSGSVNGVSGTDTPYPQGIIEGYTTSNLLFEASTNELGLNPKINITSITAATASFSELKVTPGDAALLNTEEVIIEDNFIFINSNIGENIPESDGEDAGFSINRGAEPDANLFWDEASKRWSINLTNIQSDTTATPDSHLVPTTFDNGAPPLTPIYGENTNGEGNIFINTTANNQEVWIWA